MKKKFAVGFILVMVIGLIWTTSAFAQINPQFVVQETLEDPTEEPEVEPTEESEDANPVCDDDLAEHPVLSWIEAQYDVPKADLLTYFCEYEFGIGEIVHLLETLARTEGTEDEYTVEELLAMRMEDEMGWGEIWQAAGLIGRGRNGKYPEGTEEPEDPEGSEGTEAFSRNEKRTKFNHQNANGGEEDQFKNENKPVTPPGHDKDKNPGNPGNPPGKDKDKNHPVNGKKP